MSKTCPSHETNKPWPMVRLGDVCDEIKDRIQSSKISVGEYVTTDNMVKDRGGIVPAEYVPSDVGLVEYHKDDVLIANIRPYLKKIWLADHDGGCSSDVVVFRSNTDGLSSEYLYSVLSQDAFFEYVMQKPRGTKMPRGDRDWMKEFRFPLPSLSVQREIVARLERELAAVEKMKNGFEAFAETAKAEFKAELKEVFEEISRGGAYPPAEGCPRSGCPSRGEMRRLGDVCERLSSGKNITAKRVFKIGVIPVYGANGLRGYTEKPNFEGECCVIGRQGALCGNVKYFKGKAYMSDHAVVAVFKPYCNARFMLHQLGIMNLRQLSTQAAQPGLSVKVLSEQEVLVPPLSIQREVVSWLDSAKARAEKLEAKAQEGVAVCETMRKAILKEAFDLGRKG